MRYGEGMGGAKFVGVDWAKGGWFSIAYDADGNWEAHHGSFTEIVERYSSAKLILVDIPIGLAKGECDWRKCDLEARKCLGSRWQSVFLTPPRCVVDEARKTKESALTHAHFQNALTHVNKHRREKMGFSVQSWNITPMIVEVDDFLKKRKKEQNGGPAIREVHPEICFRSLDEKQIITQSKKKVEGRRQRIAVLETVESRTQAIYDDVMARYFRKDVGRDDVLDALAAAVTARLGYPDKLATLPENPPTDARGLPMEMVFYNPRHA